MKLIEAIVINWKRPENVEKIILALKDQTIPCTITICDCHQEEQFALSEKTLQQVDRIFRWKHNLGAYSRYIPLASYDHTYTFFIDDDMLPGKKCLEFFLQSANQLGEFGVLGQHGRIMGLEEIYKPMVVTDIKRNETFIKTDFIVRGYFVRTRYLYNVIRFRHEIGYYDDDFPEDDLLLCASLKYYENLSCYLLPFNNDPETLMNIEELDDVHGLNMRKDHYWKRTQLIKRFAWYGWQKIRIERKFLESDYKLAPAFSVCIIALNEAEFITSALSQIYDWDCCHEIIIVEGSVELYPKERVSSTGLSGDGTTALIKNFPDPQNKIIYLSGTFKDKVQQRNEYAKKVTGSHVLVLDADEFYTKNDLVKLKEDVIRNPEIDVFTFNFSNDPESRSYFHLWHGIDKHIVGGYWNIAHNRIYKWANGTRYVGADHNNPVRPDGLMLNPATYNIRCAPTRAKCIHLGFAKSAINQKDKNEYYVSRGEGNEPDDYLRRMRQMYINCRKAGEQWRADMLLPHEARVYPFIHQIPEALHNRNISSINNC